MQEIMKIKKAGDSVNGLKVIEASALPSGRSRRHLRQKLNARPRSRRSRFKAEG